MFARVDIAAPTLSRPVVARMIQRVGLTKIAYRLRYVANVVVCLAQRVQQRYFCRIIQLLLKIPLKQGEVGMLVALVSLQAGESLRHVPVGCT